MKNAKIRLIGIKRQDNKTAHSFGSKNFNISSGNPNMVSIIKKERNDVYKISLLFFLKL